MEHKLVLGALGLSVLGWLCLLPLLLSRSKTGVGDETPLQVTKIEATGLRRDFVALAFWLPILIWLATLPSQAPFSSGQGWGRGFLLGGGLAFLNTLIVFGAFSRRGAGVSPFAARPAATLALCSALIAASVPLLWMRTAVIEALLGAALGWIAVSLLWLVAVDSPANEAQTEAQGFATLVMNGAAFAVTLLAAAALGVYRDFVVADVARGTYSALAIALATGVMLLFLASALLGAIASSNRSTPSPIAAVSGLFPLALGVIVPLGIGYLLATRVLDDLALFYVIAVGVALGGLCWVLVRDDAARSDQRVARVPIAAIIVALCGFMLSYQILQGFGVGLMLIAAWPATLLALPASAEIGDLSVRGRRFDVAQTLSLLGAFMAMLLISRLFATRFRADLRGASSEDQFAMFGFVAGAVVPFLLTSLWLETRQTAPRMAPRSASHLASPARLFCVGTLALTLLGAMLLLWGVKVVPAFLLGLALSIVGFHPPLPHRNAAPMVALWALSLALTLGQWTQRFLPLAEVSRASRLQFLLFSTGGVIALILMVDYGARLISSMRNRGAAQAENQTEVAL